MERPVPAAPKLEIRGPKSEIPRKSETRNPNRRSAAVLACERPPSLPVSTFQNLPPRKHKTQMAMNFEWQSMPAPPFGSSASCYTKRPPARFPFRISDFGFRIYSTPVPRSQRYHLYRSGRANPRTDTPRIREDGWRNAALCAQISRQSPPQPASTTELSVPKELPTFCFASGSGIHSPSTTNLY